MTQNLKWKFPKFSYSSLSHPKTWREKKNKKKLISYFRAYFASCVKGGANHRGFYIFNFAFLCSHPLKKWPQHEGKRKRLIMDIGFSLCSLSIISKVKKLNIRHFFSLQSCHAENIAGWSIWDHSKKLHIFRAALILCFCSRGERGSEWNVEWGGEFGLSWVEDKMNREDNEYKNSSPELIQYQKMIEDEGKYDKQKCTHKTGSWWCDGGWWGSKEKREEEQWRKKNNFYQKIDLKWRNIFVFDGEQWR